VISPTDPCSAWTAKANKRVQFGYGLNYMIDVEHAVIVDVEATPARTYDEVAATRTMLDRSKTRFGLKALSACVCDGSPARATSSTSRPSCKISRRSQTTPGVHRPTRRLRVPRKDQRPSCFKSLTASSPRRSGEQPRAKPTFKAPKSEPHHSPRRLYQRHRPFAEVRLRVGGRTIG
jgi:hypothetical protein